MTVTGDIYIRQGPTITIVQLSGRGKIYIVRQNINWEGMSDWTGVLFSRNIGHISG